MSLGLVWAQSTAGVIGQRGGLPWHLPEDLAHFRAVTDGHPVIMGRRTWESLPDRVRPLPGRRNLVLTRNPGYEAAGAEVAGSLEEAVQRAGSGRAWVIGGGRVFAAARDLADLAEVTEVDIEVAGDTFTPPLTGWRRGASSEWRTSSTGLRYRFLRYLRVEG